MVSPLPAVPTGGFLPPDFGRSLFTKFANLRMNRDPLICKPNIFKGLVLAFTLLYDRVRNTIAQERMKNINGEWHER